MKPTVCYFIYRGTSVARQLNMPPLAFPPLTGLEPRLVMDSDYKTMIHKLADVLRQVPYSMNRGADALDVWVEGTYRPAPLQDISACTVRSAHGAPWAPLNPSGPGGHAALAFEPVVADVTIQSLSGRALAAMGPVSNQWRCVTDIARGLVRDHNLDVRMAIDVAKKCWERMPPRYMPYASGYATPSAASMPDDNTGLDPHALPATEEDEADGAVALPMPM